MFAPVTEVEYGEDDLLALNLASVAAWPGFAEELQAVTGLSAGLHQTGTLSVAYDVDDAAALRRLADYTAAGLEVEELSGRDARKREPLLAAGVSGGVWVPGDHSVDNRQAVTALLRAVRSPASRCSGSACLTSSRPVRRLSAYNWTTGTRARRSCDCARQDLGPGSWTAYRMNCARRASREG